MRNGMWWYCNSCRQQRIVLTIVNWSTFQWTDGNVLQFIVILFLVILSPSTSSRFQCQHKNGCHQDSTWTCPIKNKHLKSSSFPFASSPNVCSLNYKQLSDTWLWHLYCFCADMFLLLYSVFSKWTPSTAGKLPCQRCVHTVSVPIVI